eukprot:CAMPEP_0119370848 /NCGR_PEP_ID=MMETSP1334-20130426/17140_1 /TAXON_ID=127549 /ORGANISM="Calcidiscus leptoporus, Strain RCC1130" /LENGTH=136 /DNA_ID=CAMNT_0007387999 /DNA_START=141 /DNA_END=553 /DNA_ORIENTATION=+
MKVPWAQAHPDLLTHMPTHELQFVERRAMRIGIRQYAHAFARRPARTLRPSASRAAGALKSLDMIGAALYAQTGKAHALRETPAYIGSCILLVRVLQLEGMDWCLLAARSRRALEVPKIATGRWLSAGSHLEVAVL